MAEYIKYRDIPKQLGIRKGDRILVSSAIKDVVNIAKSNGDEFDLNILIDAFKEAVGEEGTLMFPTYNWDWCKGAAYDVRSTPSQVGALSQIALNRPDFRRTRHPIYSFAVYGAGTEELCALDNKSAFGPDSPFRWFLDHGVKNIVINCKFNHSFTFVHYVEEAVLDDVRYRYLKDFRADYTDADGNTTERVYSMCVRSYTYDVEEVVDDYEEDWLKAGAQENIFINGIRYAVIDLRKTYPIIEDDILHNDSRKLCSFRAQREEDSIEQQMYGLVTEMYPLCRSLTGDGVRNTLSILRSYLPQLEVKSIPSGTPVYDWTVPPEWNITEAYIEDEAGERVVDFKKNNLHVVGYSCPMDETLELEDLKKILHTLPDQPDWIPYVTSYYKRTSGFCMSQKQMDALQPGKYHARIKSTLNEQGVMNWAELYIPGETEEEILLSTYICHPSMANNECSGPAVATFLAKYLLGLEKRRYSYRILYVPETIGAIAWLSQNYDRLHLKDKVKAGFVINCCGDERTYSIVQTPYADTLADKVLNSVLKTHYPEYNAYSFLGRGSDERQFNSPLIGLPVCSVCRSRFHKYPEYHTSGDDLNLVTPAGLGGTYELMKKVIAVLEGNARYRTTVPCEPQMGKRGLYASTSVKGSSNSSLAMMLVLVYCDGKNDLMDLAKYTELDVMTVLDIVNRLYAEKLLEKV